ncbi:MAG: endo-1,4-beta-xylanase, partial [Spirulinaceae cyanobacterium SM2_1_0]|nr:endo-1,4-beta-xylanase [Spirulinaceae cyanobacterium SM2_1_0]
MPLRHHPTPLKIGSATRHLALTRDPHYPTILAREFNLLVPENAMKCGTICAQQDTYDFTAA